MNTFRKERTKVHALEKNFNMGLLDSGQMLLPNGTLEQRIDGIPIDIGLISLL